MLKKIFILILIFVIFLPTLYVKAEDNITLLSNARSGLLVETSSGNIIYEKNINERVSVASMTKMMGMILVMESLEDGKIRLDEKVKTSKNASDMGGSQIWLSEGEEMLVSDLIKGVMMASANDGIVSLAERIGGTEEKFVAMMNEKAKLLGLKNTNFVNPTGLDEEGHYSSAYDMSIIARELMKHEDIFKYTSVYEDYLRKGTENEYWLVNTNKLIKTFQGADGLKTGMTDNAGYCMAVTAKRNGMRLLAIVLGEENGKVRNQETAELLEYGFSNYELETIKKKGDVLGTIHIDKTNKNNIEIVASKDVTVLKNKGSEKKEYRSDVKLHNLKLPITKGSEIGDLVVLDNLGNQIDKISVTVNEDIKKDNFLNIYLKILLGVIQGELV
ncbi:MAG: D-alanyl-D-alanine carboxypeptidase [Bacilli bacterium]|nr:D-alanyl-D-alanine carboxypeptidase [Bacilli bacterium]